MKNRHRRIRERGIEKRSKGRETNRSRQRGIKEGMQGTTKKIREHKIYINDKIQIERERDKENRRAVGGREGSRETTREG